MVWLTLLVLSTIIGVGGVIIALAGVLMNDKPMAWTGVIVGVIGFIGFLALAISKIV